MKDGFLSAACGTPALSLADCRTNAEETFAMMRTAEKSGVKLLILPELGLTGATCGDLFLQDTLLRGAEDALSTVLEATRNLEVVAAVGLPLGRDGRVYDCAAVIQRGRILGVAAKRTLSPAERRWFAPAPIAGGPIRLCGQTVPFGAGLLFPCREMPDLILGVEFGEDLRSPAPPSVEMARRGATVIGCLDASPEAVGQDAWRRQLAVAQSGRLLCGYLYSGAGEGESTSDRVYGAHQMIAENGALLAERRFDGGLLVSELDVQRLAGERRRTHGLDAVPPAGPGRHGGRAFHGNPPPWFGGPVPPFGGAAPWSGGPVPPFDGAAPWAGGPVPPFDGTAPWTGGPVPPFGGTAPGTGGTAPASGGDAAPYGGEPSGRGAAAGRPPFGPMPPAFSLTIQRTKLTRYIPAMPFVPEDGAVREERCREVLFLASLGLKRRLEATHSAAVVVGLSGGLDSTLAILIAGLALKLLRRPMTDILAVTMPCFGTTDRTRNNAVILAERMGAALRTVDISAAVRNHLRDIGHDPSVRNTAYENAQARERTQVLMDLANDCGGLVVGTGDLSELALGWCTYNGDHMSMYAVNASIPKTLVRHLVAHLARESGEQEMRGVLEDILDTPVSPELLPAVQGEISQRTEDLVGPYELHDFFLYYHLRWGFSPGKVYRLAVHALGDRYSREVILKWLRVFYRRFFSQQFKRNCVPDGPAVGSVGLSPRGAWSMPSDASAALWMAEAEALQP